MRSCILLAGGLGTRIRHVTKNGQKCLASVANRPFLTYIIQYLIDQRVDHFIFSLGYKADETIQMIQSYYPNINKTFVVEDKPLGTGGAIKKSLREVKTKQVFVVNADTFFPVSLQDMENRFNHSHPDILIAGLNMKKPDRYGTIEIDIDWNVKQFHEKQSIDFGYINGGVYLMDREILSNTVLETPFSFEKDLLEAQISKFTIQFIAFDCPFIDIGVPIDYYRSQRLLSYIYKFEPASALILDRDGVVNKLLPGDYVRIWGMFSFRDGFLEFLEKTSKLFKYVFIVTNQQGIGKELMSENDLVQIHSQMLEVIQQAGGNITKIYHCPHLISEQCNCRKPKTGMLDQVASDFPDVHWESSLLIGDSLSDMELAAARNIPSIALLHEFNKETEWKPEPVFTAGSFKEIEHRILPALHIIEPLNIE